MNFRSFIESFDQPANIFWEDQTDGGWMGTFQIEDKKFMIMFEEHEKYPDIYEIAFNLTAETPKGGRRVPGIYTISRTGNSMLVFSTVMQAIKEFDSVKKPAGYVFDILEPKRTRLYRALADKFGATWTKKISGKSMFVLRSK